MSATPLSSRISLMTIPLSFGTVTLGIFVQYNLRLDCAETRLELISIGSTPSYSLIISLDSLFMTTFSSIKYFGLHCLKILTNSKNNLLLGSSKFKRFPDLLKPWQGEPPINKSILLSLTKLFPSILVTSPT